jgi:spore maturation protein CgeB
MYVTSPRVSPAWIATRYPDREEIHELFVLRRAFTYIVTARAYALSPFDRFQNRFP